MTEQSQLQSKTIIVDGGLAPEEWLSSVPERVQQIYEAVWFAAAILHGITLYIRPEDVVVVVEHAIGLAEQSLQVAKDELAKLREETCSQDALDNHKA